MTKKHYIAIAAGFKSRLDEQATSESDDGIKALLGIETLKCAHMFCNIAASDNPNFNRQRFMIACGFVKPL